LRCAVPSFQVAVALHFADVVHQAVEQPLGVDLGPTAVAEASEWSSPGCVDG
jgi:hypothetical protein